MPKGGSRRRSIGRERHKGSSRDRKRARKSPANDSIGNTRGTPRPRYTENTQTTTPGVQPEEWICDESEESFCEPGLENAQLNYEQYRQIIAGVYVLKFHCPKRSLWKGRGGFIGKCTALLDLPEGSSRTIERVWNDTVIELKEDRKHTLGLRRAGSGGHNKLIADGSVEQQIICDAMENGQGFRMTKIMVNKYRRGKNLQDVGMGAICSSYNRMDKEESSIKRGKQGSNDPSAPWTKARLNWCVHLLVRFGVTDSKQAMAILGIPQFTKVKNPVDGREKTEHTKIPDWINPEKMPCKLGGGGYDPVTLRLQQVAFWDEMHVQVSVGSAGSNGSMRQVRFPRDENGKYCPTGTLRKRGVRKKFKYSDEARVCLGVAMVELLENEEKKNVGRRGLVFSYTGKWITTIPTHAKYRKEQMGIIKKSAGTGGWTESGRNAGELFMEDSVCEVKGIGARKVELLRTRLGITTVKELSEIDDIEIDDHCGQNTGLTCKWVKRKRDICKKAQPGPYPPDIQHHKADNPYLSRYGEDWERHCDSDGIMKKYCCITKLVTHIIEESQKMFDGTTHEKDWMFYHDALIQLTNTDTVEWMKKTKDRHGVPYYSRWIVPILGCNADTKYADRPVGNSPELMPMDCSLNADVRHALARHVAQFHGSVLRDDSKLMWPDNTPRRFSLTTPKRITDAILRIYDPAHGPEAGSPISRRICEDVSKFLENLDSIVKNDPPGGIVEGLGNRQGRRPHGQAAQRGGRRPTQAVQAEDLHSGRWLHEHARKAQDEQIARSVRTATVETLFQGAEGMDETEEADLAELQDDYLEQVELQEGDINGRDTTTLRDLEEALTDDRYY